MLFVHLDQTKEESAGIFSIFYTEVKETCAKRIWKLRLAQRHIHTKNDNYNNNCIHIQTNYKWAI